MTLLMLLEHPDCMTTVTGDADRTKEAYIREFGATVTPVALTGSDQVVLDHFGVYRGFTVIETAGSTAVVRVYDNASTASGTVVDEISLNANESAREYYASGIRMANGIYVKIVSGSVAGSVRTG